MSSTCKECGGNIIFDKENSLYVCDSCGNVQTQIDQDSNVIYNGEQTTADVVEKYNHALNTMNMAVSENMFTMAAMLFDQTGGFSDSVEKARECRRRAAELRTERRYATALEDMCSPDPEKISRARETLVSLGDYKQSRENAEKCLALYSVALKNQPKPAPEAQKPQTTKKKKRVPVFLIIVIIIVGLVVGHKIREKAIYSADNIKVEFSPKENSFLTEQGNSYVFNFDVTLENDGRKDVEAIEGVVAFINKENNVIVDTQVSFSGSPIAVRHGKSSKYSWSLTVYSQDTAKELYYTDFQDFDVDFDITTIRFSNGKIVKYE